MDDNLVFYILKKAIDLTNYLTDAYYCGTHYIRYLMCSWATTRYKFYGILKIEEEIDVTESQQGCDGVKAGAVEIIELTKKDCRVWYRTILFAFLSFFFPYSHGISFTSHLGY